MKALSICFILRQLSFRAAALVATLFLIGPAPVFATDWSEIANSQHSLKNLGSEFYIDVPLAPVEGARLVLFNKDAAKRLGLEIPEDPAALEKMILKNFALFVNKEHPTTHMMATYYLDSGKKEPGGALGDGRAVWTGESRSGNFGVDFVLKGIGPTPLAWENHSDSGHKDGLQSMTEAIHSFIHSEANFRNGLDSTVDLAVIEIPQQKLNKYTGKMENATITLRAGDQLRVAHLSYHADNPENFKKIFNYAMKREFGINDDIREFMKKFTVNLAEESARYFDLHAVHGSPTHGNRTLRGATIDMGTFRYLDANHQQYSYLFKRLKYKNQTDHFKMSLDKILYLSETAQLISRKTSKEISSSSEKIFQETYENTLKDIWLGRLGLTEVQMQGLSPQLKDEFYKATLALYQDEAISNTELSGQKVTRTAFFDVRSIFQNVLTNIATNAATSNLIVKSREWQNSSLKAKVFFDKISGGQFVGPLHMHKLANFKKVAMEVIQSLELSPVEWYQLYTRSKAANHSKREVPVDEIFFNKEKEVAALIESKKSFLEISKVALDSSEDLVDTVPERRSQPQGYQLMKGVQQSLGGIRCEKIFAL